MFIQLIYICIQNISCLSLYITLNNILFSVYAYKIIFYIQETVEHLIRGFVMNYKLQQFKSYMRSPGCPRSAHQSQKIWTAVSPPCLQEPFGAIRVAERTTLPDGKTYSMSVTWTKDLHLNDQRRGHSDIRSAPGLPFPLQ